MPKQNHKLMLENSTCTWPKTELFCDYKLPSFSSMKHKLMLEVSTTYYLLCRVWVQVSTKNSRLCLRSRSEITFSIHLKQLQRNDGLHCCKKKKIPDQISITRTQESAKKYCIWFYRFLKIPSVSFLLAFWRSSDQDHGTSLSAGICLSSKLTPSRIPGWISCHHECSLLVTSLGRENGLQILIQPSWLCLEVTLWLEVSGWCDRRASTSLSTP